jgi:hypothetical protein
MQRLLRTADWGADAVRDELRSRVVEGLGPGGVLIVYETGFVKKGTRSASCVTQRAHGLSEHPLWPCDGLDCGGRVTWADANTWDAILPAVAEPVSSQERTRRPDRPAVHRKLSGPAPPDKRTCPGQGNDRPSLTMHEVVRASPRRGRRRPHGPRDAPRRAGFARSPAESGDA